ncbi:hypothetical protein Q5752_006873 [Cryptotrichosporon argae]
MTRSGDVYFLSHGGPPSMYQTEASHYAAWKRFGDIVRVDKPRGIVVASAHWENPAGTSGVVVSTDESNPLIYDFYGFPAHFYKEKFESKQEPGLALHVKGVLEKAGVSVSTAKRGLDHGVWVCLKVVLGEKTNIPIVQVSLPGDDDPVSSAKLGKALSALRDEGYAIMGAGQTVHNVRDFVSGRAAEYGSIFMSAVHDAVSSPKPLEGSLTLFRHPLYPRAHPTPEHLLPLVVAAGAVRETDLFQEVHAEANGALGWGMYRWAAKA